MALTYDREIHIVWRASSVDIYSEDDRVRRAALNAPYDWQIEETVILDEAYDDVTDKITRVNMVGGKPLAEYLAERLAFIHCRDNNRKYSGSGTIEKPLVFFKVLDAQYTLYFDAWQARERSRFGEGTYIEVPWSSQVWALPLHHAHYPHLSSKCPGKIAFTQSEAHGIADRQTVMRPGKYLLQFYGDWVNQSLVDKYCAEIDALTKHLATPLQFATTKEDIIRVYQTGPSSCMSKNADDREYRTNGVHPVSVYAAGDLAIAYFTDEQKAIKARCITWPAKKIFGRVYGDENRIAALLHRDGFKCSQSSTDWDGARLLKVKVPRADGYVCPYLDVANQRVTIGDDFLILDAEDGEYEASNVGSVIKGKGVNRERDNDEDENDENYCFCDNCNDRVHVDSIFSVNGDGAYCGTCYREGWFFCDTCDSDCERDSQQSAYTGQNAVCIEICDNCADDRASRCECCGEYWITNPRQSRLNVDFVTSVNGSDGDDDGAVGFCPTCVATGKVFKRPCGHWQISDIVDTNDCACGKPAPSKLVMTTLRTHRVGVSA